MKTNVTVLPDIDSACNWLDAEELKSAALLWAEIIGVTISHIQVRQMRSKWASISTAGRLTLNSDLLKVPRDLGEVVIVHELVHLIAPNHGKVFKSFMHIYVPEWEAKEQLLQTHR
jgi:predicted metal-dependent hydrolase